MEVALVPLRVALLAASEAAVHSPASLALASLAEAAAPASVQLQWVSAMTPKMMLLRRLQRDVLRMRACDLVVRENVDLVDLEERAFAAR